MKNLADIMKQAGQMQARMTEMQARLEATTIEGQSGGGMVKVKMTGKAVVTGLDIDPLLLKADEKEILEDLIIAALADAKTKTENIMAAEMKTVTGGMPLPPGFGF